jgi:hypothetical protein
MRTLALGIVLLLAGCVSSQAKVWQRSWNDIRQPYLDYVAADAKLTDAEKAIRVQHVALLDLTLKDITGE